VSKDFDTTLSDALDLAAQAARTAGAPAARIRGRRRAARKRMAVTAGGLILLAGGGSAAAFTAASSHIGGPTPATGTGVVVDPSTTANAYTGALDGLLLPMPSGATPLAPRQGVSGGEISADQYVANDYPGDGLLQKSATEQTLGTFGFESAAVRWYRDSQGDDVEMYLIRFSASSGAQGYGLSLASSRMQNGAVAEFPDSAAATGYGFTTPAAEGTTEADVFGYSGDIVVIMHVFAANGGNGPLAASLFSSQYSAVQTAQR
jgi:hypothetical protein